jgi:hypothetical protein
MDIWISVYDGRGTKVAHIFQQWRKKLISTIMGKLVNTAKGVTNRRKCIFFRDDDIRTYSESAACLSTLECFYIYEAPWLSYHTFEMLVETFPDLCRFGNLTRWAINCEGIQHVVRSIKENNYDVEILCGSHWFASKCSSAAASRLSDGTQAAVAAQQAGLAAIAL